MPQPHGCSDGFPHLSECDCAPGRKSTSFHESRPWGNSPPKGFYRFSWGVSRQEEGPHLAIPVLCSSEDSPFVGPLNTEVLFEEKMRSDDDLCGNVTLCGLVAQPCLILCDPTDCSPPDFSVHGILQARILEWIAIPFSRETSQPRDRALVSCIAGRFFTV